MVKIFISYKRDQSSWVYLSETNDINDTSNPNRIKPLITRLKNTFSDEADIYFDKTRIVGGDIFDRKIRSMIDSADIVILLISSEFLDDGYIRNTEWPYIREVYEAGKVVLFPIYITHLNSVSVDKLKAMLPSDFKRDIDLAKTESLLSKYYDKGETHYRNVVVNDVINSLYKVIKLSKTEIEEYNKIISCNSDVSISVARIKDCELFINKYTKSKYLDKVIAILKSLKDRLTINQLDESFSVAKLTYIIETDPNNVYIEELKERLRQEEERAYKAITNSEPNTFVTFISLFPSSKHKNGVLGRYYSLVKEEYNKLPKESVNAELSIDERMDLFIDSFALINDSRTDKIILDVISKRDKLKAETQANDDDAFEMASKINTKESYKEYIDNGYVTYLNEAYNRIAKLTKVKIKWYNDSKFYISVVAVFVIFCGAILTGRKNVVLQYPTVSELLDEEFYRAKDGAGRILDDVSGGLVPKSPSREYETTTNPEWFCEFCDSLSHNAADVNTFLTASISNSKAIGFFNKGIQYNRYSSDACKVIATESMIKAADMGYAPAITELTLWKCLPGGYRDIKEYSHYIDEFEQAAHMGDSKAAYICYFIYGEILENQTKANSYLIQSARLGSDYAIKVMQDNKISTDSVYRDLVDIYRNRKYILRTTPKSYAKLMNKLIFVAYEAGDYELSFEVANKMSNVNKLAAMYCYGIGTTENPQKVLELSTQDGFKNNELKAYAYYKLNNVDSALLYVNRNTDRVNYIRSIQKIESPDSLIKREGLDEMISMAEHSNQYARLYLACKYTEGDEFVEQDKEKGISMMEKVYAVNKNSCRLYSQYNLGLIYYYGLFGVKKDREYANTFFYWVKNHELYSLYEDKLNIP